MRKRAESRRNGGIGPVLRLAVLAAAFGYREGAVVIYLRELYYPAGFRFPRETLRGANRPGEIGREFATLVTLLAEPAGIIPPRPAARARGLREAPRSPRPARFRAYRITEEVPMRRFLPVLALALVLPTAALAGGTLDFGIHSEPMDGLNTFPAAAHVSEAVHASPSGPCGGLDSDLHFESSAYHYFVASGSFVDTPLPPGGCMDVRQVWIAWDSANFYLGVEGPNELYERGDLFIAIDTDALSGNFASSPWAKSVDFAGWTPDYFIALEAPTSVGGYAALMDNTFSVIRDTFTGLAAADGGYVSCDVGGMYYEFAIPLSDIGVIYGTGQQVNFAVYTTYEDDGFDTYDSGPGCGQTLVWEELGDYPYDADHCGGALDPVTGVGDPSCGYAESDDALGAGVATAGRYPASDNSPSDIDTIGEYYAVTNFGQEPPTPVLPSTWGRIKTTY